MTSIERNFNGVLYRVSVKEEERRNEDMLKQHSSARPPAAGNWATSAYARQTTSPGLLL